MSELIILSHPSGHAAPHGAQVRVMKGSPAEKLFKGIGYEAQKVSASKREAEKPDAEEVDKPDADPEEKTQRGRPRQESAS